MPEFLQSADQLPNLGVSLSDWKNVARENVQDHFRSEAVRNKNVLLQSLLFAPEGDRGGRIYNLKKNESQYNLQMGAELLAKKVADGDPKALDILKNQFYYTEDTLNSVRREIKASLDPKVGKAIRDLFDDRVARMYTEHDSQTPIPTGQKGLEELRLSPMIHLILSREPVLGYSHTRIFNRGTDIAGIALKEAIKQYDGKGLIKIDLTSPDAVDHYRSTGTESGETEDSFYYVADKFGYRTHPRRQVIVIVDGYGKYAAENLGFSWIPGPSVMTGEGMLTLVIRTTEDQFGNDTDRYGSIPSISRYYEFAAKKTLSDSSPVNTEQSFAEDRFIKLAKALDSIIARVVKGDKVVLQAPNNYGKTSTLMALAELLSNGNAKNITIAQIDGIGDLVKMTGFKTCPFNEEEIQQVADSRSIVIIDEAGLENDPKNAAKQSIERLESKGVIIVRTYPGNVTPPSEYEVVKVA